MLAHRSEGKDDLVETSMVVAAQTRKFFPRVHAALSNMGWSRNVATLLALPRTGKVIFPEGDLEYGQAWLMERQ